MKDFLDRELRIGDWVVACSLRYGRKATVELGRVAKFYPGSSAIGIVRPSFKAKEINKNWVRIPIFRISRFSSPNYMIAVDPLTIPLYMREKLESWEPEE